MPFQQFRQQYEVPQYGQQPPTPYQSELSRQYEDRQRMAAIQQQHIDTAYDTTNPHKIYQDIVTNPSRSGKFPMTLMGRPVDLEKLEKYVVFNMSPKAIVTTLRYSDVRAYEDALGYGRNTIVRKKKGNFGMIIIMIIGLILMLVVGVLFLMSGGDLLGMFEGMFGGFGV